MVSSKSRKTLENDILEFIQGVAGFGVPNIDTKQYSVVLEGRKRLDGTVAITDMNQNATKNLFDNMNELVFSKFRRTIDVRGKSIYVSELI